ncbi:MAG: alkaline phosphatase D family protein [Sandaracinaceae bacterium]|nr:alkaline phosphatase D family protein [Sandaracinaceae bacterium]
MQRTYDLVQAWRTRVAGDEAHDDVLGPAQRAWLAGVVGGSDATWNVVGNPSATPRSCSTSAPSRARSRGPPRRSAST